LFSGHRPAQIAAKYQPAKPAAFEGVFKTEEGTPIHLMGIPNAKEGRDGTPDGSHQADAILDVIGDRAPGGKSLSTEPGETF